MSVATILTISLLLASAPAQDQAHLTALADEMNAAILEGKGHDETKKDFCKRMNEIYKRTARHKESPDLQFQTARSSFFEFRKAWRCLTYESEAPPDLWAQFQALRAAAEKPGTPQEDLRRQDALSAAAIMLLGIIKAKDPRFPHLIGAAAVVIVSRDAATALKKIAAGLPKDGLSAEQGTKVAEALSVLLQRLPDLRNLRKEDLDAILGFTTKLARTNPAWLQTGSGRQLLDVVVGALANVPPQDLDDARKQALVQFLSQALARDPKWLDGKHASALVGFVPLLLDRVDFTQVEKKDLDALVTFVGQVIGGNAHWPKLMQDLARNWSEIQELVIATSDEKTRGTVLEAIKNVCELDGRCGNLAKEVGKDKPDLGAVEGLLRLLGAARVQAIRKEQAKLRSQEIPQAQILRLRTLVGRQLPPVCRGLGATSAPSQECETAELFAARFRETVAGGSPEKADPDAGIFSGSLEIMLDDAKCTLMTEAEREAAVCAAKLGATRFASFVGLEMNVRAAGSAGHRTISARAGCISVSVTRVWDRVENFRTTEFPIDASPEKVGVAAQKLGEEVLNRCNPSAPDDDLASNLVSPSSVPRHASSAFLFAGLPYLRDGRRAGSPPPALGWTLSVLDASTLLAGAGTLAGAVWAHNGEKSWDDELLQTGVVLIGVNLAIKAASMALYYWGWGYGAMKP